MSDNLVHKWLVDALGEDEAASALSADGWLSAEKWAAAVERTRLRRFPDLSEQEGSRQLGLALGRALLSSDIGALIRETLPLLTLERAMETLLPLLMARMRRHFEVTWTPSPTGGGTLEIVGPIATRPETTLGFFEAIVEVLRDRPRVTLVSASTSRLELSLTAS